MAKEEIVKGVTEPVDHIDLRRFSPERVEKMLRQASELWRERLVASGELHVRLPQGLHQLIQDLVSLRESREIAREQGEEAEKAKQVLKDDSYWRF